MLSIHSVRSIKAHRLHGGDWIELTFEGYLDETISICIYAWHGSEDPTWPAKFTEALEQGINALPPTPAPASPDLPEGVVAIDISNPEALHKAIARAVGEEENQ